MSDNKCLTKNQFQEVILEAYGEFEKICHDLNLRYWLAFGTLLGAVRHQDFIPWDDDFDICMPRDDYEKLFNFFKGNNNIYKHYSLMDYRLVKKYPYCCARFNDNRYIEIESNTRQSYGLGVNFDIYPLDGVEETDKRHIKKLKLNRKILELKVFKKQGKSKKSFINLIKSLASVILRFFSPRKNIKKMNRLAIKYPFGTTKYCGDIVWDWNYNRMQTCWFEKTVFLPFHGLECPVPDGYKELLSFLYHDFMQLPPIEKRKGYHVGSIIKK